MRSITAIYPGSFDPVTNGHLDLIHRGCKLFDHLIVAIAFNPDKGDPLFSIDERMEMLKAMTAGLDNVTVDAFEGLLMTYCIHKNANAVLRSASVPVLRPSCTNAVLQECVKASFSEAVVPLPHRAPPKLSKVAVLSGNRIDESAVS